MGVSGCARGACGGVCVEMELLKNDQNCRAEEQTCLRGENPISLRPHLSGLRGLVGLETGAHPEAGASETGRAGRARSRKGGGRAPAAGTDAVPAGRAPRPRGSRRTPLDAERQAVMQGCEAAAVVSDKTAHRAVNSVALL